MTQTVTLLPYNVIVGGVSMYCEGSVIVGKGSTFKLLYGEETNQNKINEIKNKLNNMTNYIDDFVIIDFLEEIPIWEESQSIFEKETMVFFQAVKNNSYKKLNFYEVEIRIDSKNSNKMYERSVRKKELLKLFDGVCVQKKIPDLSKWKKFYDSSINGDWSRRPRVMNGERKAKIKQSGEIVRKWWLNELPKEDFSIYFDGLKYLAEEGWSSDVTYEEVYIQELYNLGLGKEILEKFKKTTSPTILEFIGKQYLKGTCGVSPDYRKAYRYFYHGDRRGSLLCRYNRALMYKNGLYVKKNYNKYVKLIESIPKEFISVGGENVLPFIDFAFIELARIYKEKGDCEKCLEYAYKAKELNDSTTYEFLEVTKMPEILDIIYSVIPFDKDDMDVYDLLYLFKQPAKAKFYAKGKEYNIESINLNGYCMVKFNDKYYKNAIEFFNKAVIDDKKFYEWINNVDYVEVV